MLVKVSSREFFDREVKAAASRQRAPLSDSAQDYLVTMLNLLGGKDPPSGCWVMPDRLADVFVGAVARKAKRRRDPEAAKMFQVVGDTSLTVTGLFPERIENGLLGPGYYIDIGRRAFDLVEAPPFAELAAHFDWAISVLREIGLRCAMRSDSSVVRLLSGWRKSKDPLVAAILKENGLLSIN